MPTPVSPQPHIDHEFISAHQKLILEEYHYLAPLEQRAQKTHFYDTGELDFTYDISERLNMDVHRSEIAEIGARVEASDMSAVARSLYQAKLQEQDVINDILSATLARDDHAFHTASVALYGAPDPQLFWLIVSQINSKFASLMAKVDRKRTTLHKAYRVWQEYFSSLTKPERVGVYHLPIYPGVYIPNDYDVDSAEQIHLMFSDYLEKKGIQNWTVQIDHPGARTSFGVNQITKVISIPHDSDLSLRKLVLTKTTLQALLVHEVGVHVVRRENGEASPLALLGVGLDNYLRAEEGIATLAEQLITGTENYSGEVGYFSIGAAMGIHGPALGFSELYQVLNAYYILSIANQLLERDGYYEPDELRMTAFDNAWNRSLRVYRGTTGTTPGAVYTRDIVYLEGNRAMWRLLDSDTEIDPRWLVGKYDPANPGHVAALEELGILS